MNIILRFFAAFFALAVSVHADTPVSKSRRMLSEAAKAYHFKVRFMDGRGRWIDREYEKIVPKKIVYKPSYRTLRDLEELFEKRSAPADPITTGLLSIAENLGVDDIASEGVSWRNDDSTLGFRSLKSIRYQYKPQQFPNSWSAFLDEAFVRPVRIFVSRF